MRKITLLFILNLIGIHLIFGQALKLPESTDYSLQKITLNDVDLKFSPANVQKSTKAVIWQDDFSTPSNWTVSNGAGATGGAWQFGVSAGSLDTYTSYGGTKPFNPPTKANGGAFFNGIQYLLSGPPPVINSIITWAGAPIDLSAYSTVVLSFYERYKAFNYDTVFVELSNDNVIWQSIPLHTDIVSNSYFPDDFIKLNISSYVGNSATVWIRFRVSALNNDPAYGSCYGWRIDDAKIEAAPANDMVIEQFWPIFSGGFYSKIPTSCITDLYFAADVLNFGSADQTNVALHVTVNDLNSDVYDKTGTPIATMISQAQDSLGIDLPFSPPAIPKSYDVTFETVQDATDEDISNNIETVSFAVSDTVYARDYVLDAYTGPSRYSTITDGDYFGVMYYFPVQQEVNSISVFIRSMSNVGATLIAKIYADDGAGNLIEYLASDVYTVDSAALGAWVTLPFVKDGTSEIMAANMVLYAVIESYGVVAGATNVYYGADNSTFQSFQDGTIHNYGGTLYYLTTMPMIRLNVKSSLTTMVAYITSKTGTSCNGDTDGTATVSATGGIAPYTYAWSNNQTTETAVGLAAGTYTVTVIDDSFNEATVSVFITEPAVLTATDTPTWNSIDLSVTGGTIPYSYLWSNGATTQDIESLSPGVYIVTITDSHGCTTTLTEVITNIDDASSKAINVYPNPTKGILNVENAENSSIKVYNIIGDVVASVNNASTVTKIDISNLAEGSYIVKILSDKKSIVKKINLIK